MEKNPKQMLERCMPWLLAISVVLSILNAVLSIRSGIRNEKAAKEEKAAKKQQTG